MPTWGELVKEIQSHTDKDGKLVPGIDINQLRQKYLKHLFELTNRNIIAYYSGWLKTGRTSNVDINDSDITGFMNAIKDLDCDRGLDLILHTPGGNPTATEGIVRYLRTKFNDIRVIVPQMAMSAGSMLACAGNSIVMGAHSCLGPIDPQFVGIPAYNIVEQFRQAKKDLENNPKSFHYWKIQLEKYNPAFLNFLLDAIELSGSLTEQWLMTYMFSDLDSTKAKTKAEEVVEVLNSNNKSHSKHFMRDDCEKMGLRIVPLEDCQEFQEAVLSVHHSFIINFDVSNATKIIENHLGACYISQQPVTVKK